MLLPFLPSAKSLTNNPKLFCRNTESIEDSPGASGFTESQTEKVNSPEDTHESPSSASCTRDCKSSERRALTEQLPLFLHVAPLLENTGSVARDHLANERTWLAYIRTSLAISGTGIGMFYVHKPIKMFLDILKKALVQLFTVTALSDSTIVVSAGGMDLFNLGNALPRIIRPLGCTIILSGIGVLLIGEKVVIVVTLQLILYV